MCTPVFRRNPVVAPAEAPVGMSEARAMILQYNKTAPELILEVTFNFPTYKYVGEMPDIPPFATRFIHEVHAIRRVMEEKRHNDRVHIPSARDVVVFCCSFVQERLGHSVTIQPTWNGFDTRYYAYTQQFPKVQFRGENALNIDELIINWREQMRNIRLEIVKKAIREGRAE